MRVYVAGPYTRGDQAINVRRAIEAGNRLAEAGHHPFIPHLTMFWHLLYPHEYRFWMDQDRAWLKACEAVVRLPGESAGADEETRIAELIGLPVFGSVEDLLREYPHG